MSLKLKALLQVVTIFGLSVIGGSAVTLLLQQFSSKTVLMGLAFCVILYVFYLLYQVTLSRLESEAKLKELTDKFN